MNDYTTHLLATGRTTDRLLEADRERLARTARAAQPATSILARLSAALRGLAVSREGGTHTAATGDCTSGAVAS